MVGLSRYDKELVQPFTKTMNPAGSIIIDVSGELTWICVLFLTPAPEECSGQNYSEWAGVVAFSPPADRDRPRVKKHGAILGALNENSGHVLRCG